MSNSYFKFKQFTIYQDKCAMKVGTDGVLLGIWTDAKDAKNALDIGTGSGLIALMMAQRNLNLKIDAIDIDNSAIEQAKENIKQSPFHMQIDCRQFPLQDFKEQANKKYDLIVSNPPFFIQSLKSPDKARSLARHTDSLSADVLINISSELLTSNGKLCLIYPFEYKNTLLMFAKQNNLHASRITNVYPTPNSLPKRILMELSKTESPLIENSLIIERERHIYSENFIELAKDFYLKL